MSPASVAQVGTSDPADTRPTRLNHQYDLTWFNEAVQPANMPAVSYLKAPEYEDGHAGYSDPLDEQRFIVAGDQPDRAVPGLGEHGDLHRL